MDQNNCGKDISKHILPASSNLLGLCFLILNFIRIMKINGYERMFMDRLVGVSVIFFFFSSFLSYLSMRSKRGEIYEKTADIIFLLGLVLLAAISAFTAFEIV